VKLTIDHRKTVALLLLYAFVGIVAGVGAIIFQQLLSVFNILLQEGIAGYTDIKIITGIRRFTLPWTQPQLRVWFFPILVGLGGLVTGIIVYRFAPEAAGHGTDEVINSYHHKSGEIRLRVSVVKTIASAITIGSGGSGGKEGPIAQVGAGFGSFICSRLPWFAEYRKEVMLAGMAAGIAAIFRAPLAGAIFAAEILHSDMRYDGRVIIPGIVASTVSYGVYALYFGFNPVFAVPAFDYVFSLYHLFPLTLLGLVSALAAIFFVRFFYSIRNLFVKLPIPVWLKPAIGGVLTGIIALRIPSAMGEGSFHLQRILNGEIALMGVIALFFVKMITTSCSIGSGGSGGVFGPSLFIGAALGAAFAGLFLAAFPGYQIPVVVFVLLGMVGFFAAAANAPLSTVIIISEMTGVFTLLVPFLWVSMFGYIFSQKWNIYENQIRLEHNLMEITEGATGH
jgi:chloride channel protein, CIC family